jgi:beta-lactamase regulating signal transducer with metallopeptidase domain
MTLALCLPLLISVFIPALDPVMTEWASPAVAARTLVTAGVVCAATSAWAFALMAATLLDQLPFVVDQSQDANMPLPDPIPEPVAVLALGVLVAGLFRLGSVLLTRRSAHRRLTRMRAGRRCAGDLLVADSPTAHAFAIPGRPGLILITTGMLAALDAQERRVLIAHERAHLRHRHHRLQALIDLAAAVNPLLIPARGLVAFLLERWADEDAAADIGSRELTARSLARAALAGDRTATFPPPFAGYVDRAVTRRVTALSRTPPPDLRVPAVALLAGALVTILPLAEVTADVAEIAQALHLLPS